MSYQVSIYRILALGSFSVQWSQKIYSYIEDLVYNYYLNNHSLFTMYSIAGSRSSSRGRVICIGQWLNEMSSLSIWLQFYQMHWHNCITLLFTLCMMYIWKKLLLKLILQGCTFQRHKKYDKIRKSNIVIYLCLCSKIQLPRMDQSIQEKFVEWHWQGQGISKRIPVSHYRYLIE